uniref:Uncharacterized protein n=1 Tax=Arundo donax TaxID=35708 RepID=A0A0A9HDT4_ARUDO
MVYTIFSFFANFLGLHPGKQLPSVGSSVTCHFVCYLFCYFSEILAHSHVLQSWSRNFLLT